MEVLIFLQDQDIAVSAIATRQIKIPVQVMDDIALGKNGFVTVVILGMIIILAIDHLCHLVDILKTFHQKKVFLRIQ